MTLVSRLKTTGPGIAMGAAAATTVLAILGIAGTVMSMHCAPDAVACGTTPAAVVASTPAPPDKDQERLATALPPAPTPAAIPATAGSDQVIAVARNDMIIGTFDMLTQPLVPATKPAKAEAVAEAALPKVDLPMAAAETHELVAKRSTVAIDNSEAAKAIDRELGGNAPTETTLAYAPATVPKAAEPATEPVTKSLASADLRTVGGAGVNVRSGPGKSSGKLFALAGGAEVTVKEDRGGWLHIIDAKGRSGWAYKTFLTP
ncbi:SH3 domain-containing protein [Devosia sp.]|uniref:SH3 domain-containing protein n=1 Tax=Devosia sp. TaxID=1871048 RepID=UPI003BA9193F